MYSITTASGSRTDYQTYREFSEKKDGIKAAGFHYVSYYDGHGDTHICLYACAGNTVMCCGIRRDFAPQDWDRQGAMACDAAARIARSENYAEFLGWSIY